jgi:hypothetical protein
MSRLAIVTFLAALTSASAWAWEGSTTHAGLSEQAALSSSLHQRLVSDFGISNGLMSQLTIPPQDATSLFALLKRLDPSQGFVPDGRGRQTALAWFVAGSAMADSNFAHNHFLDPKNGTGLDGRTVDGVLDKLRHTVNSKRVGEGVHKSGVAATAWIVDPKNPFNMGGFMAQYAKAVSARTPGERQRHLAAALVAAGAIAHVVQDMASPSHVRVDIAAHLDPASKHPSDVGSRLERLASLTYGRLGIGDAKPTTIDSLDGHFVGDKGLATITSRGWYSRYTVPTPQSVSAQAGASEIASAIRRAVGSRDIFVDASADGRTGRILDSAGRCLLLFSKKPRSVEFDLDDACVLEQVATLLPLAVSYSGGLLDYLFRGSLKVSRQGTTIQVRGKKLGKGTIELYWDDASGVRSKLKEQTTTGKAVSFNAELPGKAVAVMALFKGIDKSGAPLNAAGFKKLKK